MHGILPYLAWWNKTTIHFPVNVWMCNMICSHVHRQNSITDLRLQESLITPHKIYPYNLNMHIYSWIIILWKTWMPRHCLNQQYLLQYGVLLWHCIFGRLVSLLKLLETTSIPLQVGHASWSIQGQYCEWNARLVIGNKPNKTTWMPISSRWNVRRSVHSHREINLLLSPERNTRRSVSSNLEREYEASSSQSATVSWERIFYG